MKIVVIRLKKPLPMPICILTHKIGSKFNQPHGYVTFYPWQSIPAIMACLQCQFLEF